MPTMPPPFVPPAWVAAHRSEIVPVDCRWSLDGSQGREQYLEGHLPGAVFVDLDTELAGPPSPEEGRHPLPGPEVFARAMERAGVREGVTVVAYDTSSGAIASRLVWMLRILGHPAAVLDGGLDGWQDELEDGEAVAAPGRFAPRPWPPAAIADADTVARCLDDDGVVIDARARERYLGDEEPIDPRAGHVPGAVNVPVADTLQDDGTLQPPAVLRGAFTSVGAAADRDVIVYCGSGVTACHDALAIEHAGLPRPRVFVESWSAWSSDPARPAATGPEPC